VKPSLSILLTDSNRPFYDDYLLPAGRLREKPENYKRAMSILYTKCPENYPSGDFQVLKEKINLLPHQELFFSSYRYKNLLPVFRDTNPNEGEPFDLQKLEKETVLLVTGLADPSGLIEYVKKYASDLQLIIYPDHHDFTQRDIQAMTDFIKTPTAKSKRIITSEKDAMRLTGNSFVPEEIKAFIYYLPIEVVILFNEELFTQKIENHVRNFKRNGILA
jgi:tetraacyldisaccharide 4'-kinase